MTSRSAENEHCSECYLMDELAMKFEQVRRETVRTEFASE